MVELVPPSPKTVFWPSLYGGSQDQKLNQWALEFGSGPDYMVVCHFAEVVNGIFPLLCREAWVARRLWLRTLGGHD